jgi:hypothetical protein
MTAKCIGIDRVGAAFRRCLSCQRAFASTGTHERVCPRCKESEEWLSAAAEFHLTPAETLGSGE